MSHISGSARVALALSLALGLTGIAAPQSAFAVCTGRSSSPGYWFDGWGIQNAGSTVGGVYAQIENQNVVASTGVGTTAWVMISNASTPQYYAQVGWIQHANGNRNTMLQVHDPTSGLTTRTSDDPQSVGSYPYYTVLYNSVPGKFTFQVAGANHPWSGYQVTAGFTPNQASIMGETQNRANQMPGTTSDALGFFDAHKYVSGSWQNFGGSAFATGGASWLQYDGPYYGTTHYIWDGAC
jgi:hypothetical protein